MRTRIEHAGIDYTLALDDERAAGQRCWGVVQGRLLDELTGRPLRSLIRVESDRAELSSRVSSGAIAGLAGFPQRAFNHPDLAVNAHAFTIIFHAEGYLPLERLINLGPIPGFPHQFFPLDLGDIGMHREPVVILGRVVRSDGSAVAGVTVRIEALWRQLPSASASPPADPLHLMGLHQPLGFPRNAGVAWLRRRELIDVVGEDKQLLSPVTAGRERIHCSDRINLAVGDMLAIDTEDPELTEYRMVSDLQGALSPAGEAEIVLATPLLRSHRLQAVVSKTLAQPPGPDNLFGVDAIAGDGCVLLDSEHALAGALVAEIGDGSQPNEYRRMLPFATNTDADGYFRLPPLSRVAQLDLRVFGGTLSADIDGFVPDYGGREHWLDVRI
ncbi:MAG: hypothetical protein P8103_08330 [Candidatus Thiodiazotropha sp.]